MKADVIVMDPPWDFEVWNRDTGNGRSASAHYPTMSLDEICQIPINNIAGDNCALFMWCVWPRIFDAKRVFDAYGFTYKTLGFEWIKLNRSGIGWHLGMGYYGRANGEPCLLAVKGKMPVAVRNERNLIVTYEDGGDCLEGLPMAGFLNDVAELPLISPIRSHSEKPEAQYQKIESLYPDCTYVEIFARRQRPGWISLGNEIDGQDIYEALKQEATNV